MKGIAYINKRIQYRIHATDRVDAVNGVIVADFDLEEFASRITVFESGMAIIKTPDRTVEFCLKTGELICG